MMRPDTVTLCMGDAQIGFRGGEPFHDERALSLGLIAAQEILPDNIVLTGDMVDLTPMSRYEQRQDWMNSTQRSIDRYHGFLADLHEASPESHIVAVHGNHELRMNAFVQRNAEELLGLHRAGTEELGVLTLQYLVRYGDLEVESVEGYPNAAYWLEDDLKVMHGTQTRRGGSNAAAYLQREMTSTVYGHSHRLEVAYRTLPARNGSRTLMAASPGCLARTDGAVPGVHHSVDDRGNMVPRAEDWQQGALVVLHNDRVHNAIPLRIDEEGMQLFDRKVAA